MPSRGGRSAWRGYAAGPGALKATDQTNPPNKHEAVIARHLADLDAAEAEVNRVYGAWRAGEPTELAPALDAMLERWRSLPEGGELVVEWHAGRGSRHPLRTR